MKRTLLIALALTATAYASADSLFITGFVANEFRFVLTTFTGGFAGTNTEAGPLAATLNGTFSFNAYCVDSVHAADIGSNYNTTLVPLPNANLNNSGRIAYLYQTFASGVANADQGAGLQLAIWDVLVDGGDGLSVGNFQASSTVNTLTDAANYLSQSVGHSGSATWYQGLPRGAQNQPQDLVGGTPVPEPASILVLGSAALIALRMRRRA